MSANTTEGTGSGSVERSFPRIINKVVNANLADKSVSVDKLAQDVLDLIGSGGGETSFQIGSVDLHNGGVQSAQVLKFDDASKQSVITGPTPPSGNSAQRIIVQGQRASGNGEGGDVYVWGGDADVNGGDIKIYAGDADSPSTGQGGYVNIDAGHGYEQGGNVNISAGNSSLQGGDINIRAGYPGGNVDIQSLNNTSIQRTGYTMGPYTVADGNYYGGPNQEIYINISDTPALGSIIAPGDLLGDGNNPSSTTPIVSITNDGEYLTIVAAHSWLSSNPQTVIFSSPSRVWTFGADGNLVVPGNILLNNGTSVAVGTYDNGYYGNKGVSLNCAVGYELNWQAGHLKSTYNNGEFAASIYIDSPITYSPTVVLLSHNTNLEITNLEIDAKTGEVFDITLGGDIALQNPINPTNAKTIRVRITQDNTGGRTVTLGDKFNTPSSAAPISWSTEANKMDVLTATYHEGRDKWDIVSFVSGY